MTAGLCDLKVLTLAILAALSLVNTANAVPASPHPVTEWQPDGTSVQLWMRGDEHARWVEDTQGFTVLRDRGWFVYGDLNPQGRLVPTDLRVGRHDPASKGLRRGMQPGPSGGLGAVAAMSSTTTKSVSQATGTLANLVVLMRFANHQSRALPTKNQIDVLFNAKGGDSQLAPTGSVRDAYLEYSYGQLFLESTVVYWVDLPQTEQYYANGSSGASTRIHEALRYALDVIDADPTILFSNFDRDFDGQMDAITFLHSGYGAEWGGSDSDGTYYTDRIWSHKWSIFGGGWTGSEGVRVSSYHISPALWHVSGNRIGRIGVICHELGHFLGLPDLYDTDGSDGQGIGSYGLMANSWGFDGSQHYPPHPSPWSKIQLGWLAATEIEPGRYSIGTSEISPIVYRIDAGYPDGEYLLVENRQPVGLDRDMPQGGLAIWHIDDLALLNNEGHPEQLDWPQNGNHYRIALLQADGAFDLEIGLNRGDGRDVYHADGVAEVRPGTLPGTDGYQLGNVVQTDNGLFEISASGASMTFLYVPEPSSFSLALAAGITLFGVLLARGVPPE